MVEAQMPEVADKLTLARMAAAKYWQTGDDFDEHAARSILSGAWDDQAYVQAALAGIEAGLEMAATVAESDALILSESRSAASFGRTRKDHGELIARQIRGLALAGRGEGSDV